MIDKCDQTFGFAKEILEMTMNQRKEGAATMEKLISSGKTNLFCCCHFTYQIEGLTAIFFVFFLFCQIRKRITC